MMKLFHGAKHPGRPIDWEARVSAALTAGCLMVAIGIIASAVRAQTITSCVNTKSGAVSVISKGSCPKNTNPVVLNPTSVQTLTVKTLEVVDSNNHTVATLGKDSNGDLLTFFDSKGKRTLTLGNDATETFAGLETFDGNNIIMGDGIARTAFGEIAGADPLLNNPKLQSFGERSFDSSGSLRSFSELVLGLTADGDSVFNANVTTGKLFPTQIEFGASKSQNFAGFDIVDSTGFARQDVNLSLDGTMNSWAESDTNGVNRVLAQQADDANGGNGFSIFDKNGALQSSMSADDQGVATSLAVLDSSGIFRFLALLASGTGAEVRTLGAGDNITGILPCTPKTCSSQGFNCGMTSDACGATLNCGTCSSGQTCGGGGHANVCGG